MQVAVLRSVDLMQISILGHRFYADCNAGKYWLYAGSNAEEYGIDSMQVTVMQSTDFI